MLPHTNTRTESKFRGYRDSQHKSCAYSKVHLSKDNVVSDYGASSHLHKGFRSNVFPDGNRMTGSCIISPEIVHTSDENPLNIVRHWRT
jgi:hypothetical protein